MREIKFRAWHQYDKRMVYGPSDDAVSPSWVLAMCSANNMEPMQFTGLKDKNDKEFYEGDIVACESNGVNRYEYRVVCYDSHQTKYKTVPLVAYHQNAGNGGWTGYELRYYNEVIGNIYENADLLK